MHGPSSGPARLGRYSTGGICLPNDRCAATRSFIASSAIASKPLIPTAAIVNIVKITFFMACLPAPIKSASSNYGYARPAYHAGSQIRQSQSIVQLAIR